MTNNETNIEDDKIETEEGGCENNLPTVRETLDSLETLNRFVCFNSFNNDCVEALHLVNNSIQKFVLLKRKNQSKITDFLLSH